MFRIVITGLAKNDIQYTHDWWAEHHSKANAAMWYQGVYTAIQSLEVMPERCSLAPEQNLAEQALRQLLYGVRSRPTHRIVFLIDGSDVVILAVRHLSQDSLLLDDLFE